jgi:hypothetical protein
MRDPRVRRALVAVSVIAALPVALAPARTVVARTGHYEKVRGKVVVVSFDIAGGKVKHFTHFDTCVTVPVLVPDARMHSNGTFAFHVKKKDVTGRRFDVTVSGRSFSRTKVTGKAVYKSLSGRACHTTTKFTAVRTGSAQNSPV